jgi:hypothetical protein
LTKSLELGKEKAVPSLRKQSKNTKFVKKEVKLPYQEVFHFFGIITILPLELTKT